jgi:adenosine deaminase
MTLSTEVLRKLPKTDLHLHLDGSLRPRTVWELAKEQNVKLPAKTPAELARKLTAGSRTKSLADYLKIFDVTLSVRRCPKRSSVAYELAEDCAAGTCGHDAPSPILHQDKARSTLEPVLRGSGAEGDFKMSTGVICGMATSVRAVVPARRNCDRVPHRGVVAPTWPGRRRTFRARSPACVPAHRRPTCLDRACR